MTPVPGTTPAPHYRLTPLSGYVPLCICSHPYPAGGAGTYIGGYICVRCNAWRRA